MGMALEGCLILLFLLLFEKNDLFVTNVVIFLEIHFIRILLLLLQPPPPRKKQKRSQCLPFIRKPSPFSPSITICSKSSRSKKSLRKSTNNQKNQKKKRSWEEINNCSSSSTNSNSSRPLKRQKIKKRPYVIEICNFLCFFEFFFCFCLSVIKEKMKNAFFF